MLWKTFPEYPAVAVQRWIPKSVPSGPVSVCGRDVLSVVNGIMGEAWWASSAEFLAVFPGFLP